MVGRVVSYDDDENGVEQVVYKDLKGKRQRAVQTVKLYGHQTEMEPY